MKSPVNFSVGRGCVMSLDADEMLEKICSYFNGKFENVSKELKEEIQDLKVDNSLKGEVLSLTKETNELKTQVFELEKEKMSLLEQNNKLLVSNAALEKKTNNSFMIGRTVEENLFSALESIKQTWGTGFEVEDMHKKKHSGDFLVTVTLGASEYDSAKAFKILIDSKNYNDSGVKKAHFEQAVRDAKNVQADAIVIVYSDLVSDA